MGGYISPGPPRWRPPRRPRPPRRCPRGTIEYRVRRGDTLAQIARRYNTTIRELRRLNPDIDPRDLRPGQIICVPDRWRDDRWGDDRGDNDRWDDDSPRRPRTKNQCEE